jgi:predicted alpha/beta hydrolase family esterase
MTRNPLGDPDNEHPLFRRAHQAAPSSPESEQWIEYMEAMAGALLAL